MLDYHLHLLPHGGGAAMRPLDAGLVREYAGRAGAAGVREIAVTEHLFRFAEAQALLDGWWEDEPDPRLRAQTRAYLASERIAWSLDEYVAAVVEAAADPGEGAAAIRLGLEVDYYPGRMDAVARLLARHPFDVLLGSVHWLGAWGFDQYDDPVVAAEWDARAAEAVWDAYVAAVEAMAGSGVCDVLAHVDLAKVTGVRAPDDGFAERLVKAASAHDLCVEVSSAGWRKPVGEAYPAPALLAAMHDAGVGITFASDAHDPDTVGDRIGEVVSTAIGAGYTAVCTFSARMARPTAIGEPPVQGDQGDPAGQASQAGEGVA